MLLSWLRTRTQLGAQKSRHESKPARRQATFRPRLESLEGRDVPSTFIVNSTYYDGPGYLTLPTAITDANQNSDTQNTIQIAIPNTDRGYNPTTGVTTIALFNAAELQITKTLTIQGPGAGLLTISGAGGSGYSGSRVFEIDGAATTVNLSGMSITGGTGLHYSVNTSGNVLWGGGGSSGTGTASDGLGGAIWNGGVLNVTDCKLSNNSADSNPTGLISTFSGGAIYNAGTLTILDSDLEHNTAGDANWTTGGSRGNGGAIYNAGKLTVNTSTLPFNTAYGAAYSLGFGTGIGGAIDNLGALFVNGGAITGNTASFGGAIASGSKAAATLTGVTLSTNNAAYGGAIWNDGTMTLSGVTVTDNTATSSGGGIYDAKDGHLTIQSMSTVTGNTAPTGANLDAFGPVKISTDSTVG